MTDLPQQTATQTSTTQHTDTPDGRVEPLTIGEDITITDAFVNFNINYSNPGELYVMIDQPVARDLAHPVPADEPEDSMIAETSEGLFFGWQDRPAQPPADTSPVTKTETVEHEQYGEIERVPMFDHVVKNRQNEREDASVLSVTYKAKYPRSIPTRVEFAQAIIDRYVNGPLGTSTVSYWAHRNGHDSKYDGYMDCEVTIVPRAIYTWEIKRVEDVSDGEIPFNTQ